MFGVGLAITFTFIFLCIISIIAAILMLIFKNKKQITIILLLLLSVTVLLQVLTMFTLYNSVEEWFVFIKTAKSPFFSLFKSSLIYYIPFLILFVLNKFVFYLNSADEKKLVQYNDIKKDKE